MAEELTEKQKPRTEVLAELEVQNCAMYNAIPLLIADTFFLNIGRKSDGPKRSEPEVFQIDCSIVGPDVLLLIGEILEKCDYDIPVPVKVSSNDARQAVGSVLHDLLQ
jgi:hypothetical protein